MTIRGRGTRRGHGRGHPQPSESCTSPLLAHVENEEIQLMMKRPPKSHLNQVFKYLEMTTRGRGGLSRGSSDPLQPYRLRTSPTQPLHVSTSRGDKEQFVGDYSEGEHEEMQLIRDKFGQIGSNQHIKMAIRRKRSTRTRGRGCRGPPQPSQSCTSPTPPQKSLSPGINNEFYDYDDGDELQVIRERTNQQKLLKKQALYHEPKNLGALSGYSASKSRIGAPSSGIRIRVKGSTMNFNNEKVSGAASDSIPHSTDQPAKVPAPQPLNDVSRVENDKRNGSTMNFNNDKVSGAASDYVPHSTDQPAKGPGPQPLNGVSRAEKDKRIVISVEAISNPRRFIPQTVTREIISSVFTRMPVPAEKWKNYPVKMKDELFKDFMDKYQFASDYDHRMARTVWERTCLDRYPDSLKNARKVALKQANSTNLADTKGHGPKGMKTEIWDGLVDIWLKPEWKKRSDANRNNRAVLPDSALHTGGSISFGEHKRRMEEEMRHEVSYRDVYDRLHRKKDGDYVSKRSKAFIESYDNIMSKKYGEDCSLHPVVDSEVWVEVSGPKKKRPFGSRSLEIGTTSSSQNIGPSHTIAPIQEDIKEAVNMAMASFVRSHLVPLLEPILLRLETMHDDD